MPTDLTIEMLRDIIADARDDMFILLRIDGRKLTTEYIRARLVGDAIRLEFYEIKPTEK